MSEEAAGRPRKSRGSSTKDPDKADDRYIGARLKALRVERRWSQASLGQMLDVTFQQVQKYEKGENRISASLLGKIIQVFGVETDYFYAGLPGLARGRPTGMAEAQEPLHPGTNSGAHQDEIAELVRAYSRIADPAAREGFVALIKLWPAAKD